MKSDRRNEQPPADKPPVVAGKATAAEAGEVETTQERKSVKDSLKKGEFYGSAHLNALIAAYGNHPQVDVILFRLLDGMDSAAEYGEGARVVGALVGALLRHKSTPKRLRRLIAKEMRRLQWKATCSTPPTRSMSKRAARRPLTKPTASAGSNQEPPARAKRSRREIRKEARVYEA